ncbi:MAG: hypothetical protein WBA17_08065 [Saprospiraceae bacterium]
MRFHLLFSFFFLLLLSVGCGSNGDDDNNDPPTEDRIVGTWDVEMADGDVTVIGNVFGTQENSNAVSSIANSMLTMTFEVEDGIEVDGVISDVALSNILRREV